MVLTLISAIVNRASRGHIVKLRSYQTWLNRIMNMIILMSVFRTRVQIVEPALMVLTLIPASVQRASREQIVRPM